MLSPRHSTHIVKEPLRSHTVLVIPVLLLPPQKFGVEPGAFPTSELPRGIFAGKQASVLRFSGPISTFAIIRDIQEIPFGSQPRDWNPSGLFFKQISIAEFQ
jgi:hypothetical protein